MDYYNYGYGLSGGAITDDPMKLGLIIGGIIILGVVIFFIIKKVRQAKYTAQQEDDVMKAAKSWSKDFYYPEAKSMLMDMNNDQRMTPNTAMPTLSGLDTSGNVYVDEGAQSAIGGTKSGLAWTL